MTKKTFLFVCLLGTLAPDTHAYNHTIPMECAVTVEEGEKLPLQVKKNEKEIGHGVPEPKTLTIIPKVTKQNKTKHYISLLLATDVLSVCYRTTTSAMKWKLQGAHSPSPTYSLAYTNCRL